MSRVGRAGRGNAGSQRVGRSNAVVGNEVFFPPSDSGRVTTGRGGIVAATQIRVKQLASSRVEFEFPGLRAAETANDLSRVKHRAGGDWAAGDADERERLAARPDRLVLNFRTKAQAGRQRVSR